MPGSYFDCLLVDRVAIVAVKKHRTAKNLLAVIANGIAKQHPLAGILALYLLDRHGTLIVAMHTAPPPGPVSQRSGDRGPGSRSIGASPEHTQCHSGCRPLPSGCCSGCLRAPAALRGI